MAGRTPRYNARGLLSNLTAQTSPPVDCFDSRGFCIQNRRRGRVAVKELCTEDELMHESNSELEKQSGFRGRWLHVLARVCTKRSFFPAFTPRFHIALLYEGPPPVFIKMIAARRKTDKLFEKFNSNAISMRIEASAYYIFTNEFFLLKKLQ